MFVIGHRNGYTAINIVVREKANKKLQEKVHFL